MVNRFCLKFSTRNPKSSLYEKKNVCYVCHIEITQSTVTAFALLVLLERPQQVRCHQAGFVIF